MKKLITTFCLLLLAAAVLAADVYACGDKFLVAGRGNRNPRVYQAAYPATVLVYLNPDSPNKNVMKEVDLEVTLEMAGHAYKMVENQGDLETELKNGRYDIVLLDYDDAEGLSGTIESAGSGPAVVPVLYNPTKGGLQAAKAEYDEVVKAPAKATKLLDAIDDVMEGRTKS